MAQSHINYRPTHIVVDPRRDEDNLIFGKPTESQIPTYTSLNVVLTAEMNSLNLNFKNREGNQDRYFSPQNARHFLKGKVGERHFRKMSLELRNYIPLSQFPWSLDEEVTFYCFINFK